MGGNYSLPGTIGFQTSGLYNFTQSGFIRRSKEWNPKDLEVDLTGKVHIVTGANSGLGFVVAKELAKRNANVIMLCRDRKKGQDALEALKKETGSEKIELKIVDLSIPSQIHDFASEFLKTGNRLDVLINSAGVLLHKRTETSDGIEVTFATHVLGSFLLTEYLLPALQKSAPSRVVTVTSGGMYPFKMTDDYQNEKGHYDGLVSYGRAKRIQVYLAEYWTKKYSNTGITFNTVHPGWARTPATKEALPGWFDKLNLRTPEQGADTILWLAVAPHLTKESGQMWFDREPQKTHIRLAHTHSTQEEVEAMYQYCSKFLDPIQQ